MAGYEKHMHAKFVMEETFMKIYHAKHYAAFQAWLENVGLLRNISTQKTERNIQKIRVFGTEARPDSGSLITGAGYAGKGCRCLVPEMAR